MRYKKTLLSNGVRLITVPKAESRAVTVLVLAEAGSKYESKANNGISHFLEHMLFKGTAKRPSAFAITSELDALGAQSNAFTSQEYTGYYATVWPKHLDKVLDVVSDMYLNPLLEPAEIEKEKGVILEEINMYEDNPARQVRYLMMELLYGDQPAGWKILGAKENIKRMNRDDFVAYRERHYVAEGTIVVVSGKFDPSAVAAKVERKFKSIPVGPKADKPPVVEKQAGPRSLVKYKKSDQAHAILSCRAYGVHDKRSFAAGVLATALGGNMSSRLFQKIREELGAAYYVRASLDTYTDHGAFAVSVGADKRRAKQVIEAILDECGKLKKEKLGDRELQAAKDYMVGNLYLDLETSSELAFYYGLQEAHREPLMRPEELAAKISAVTAEEVKEVAADIFRNNKLNLAVIGPYRDKDEFAGVLRI